MDGRDTIFVTGATGKQGHSTCRYLREAGWDVKGLTRHPDSEGGKDLRAMGVELVVGDLDDVGSYRSALDGVYGVFAVLTPFEKGPSMEVRQGKGLADAAMDAGVQHFVYSSTGGADRHTEIPHFESKGEVERYIMSTGLTWTFIRPTYFMENFNYPRRCRMIKDGELMFALPPDVPLQMIALDDIGFFAAMAFDRLEEMAGQGIELAGDSLTMPKVAELLSRELGMNVRFTEQSLEDVEDFDRDAFLMLQWFSEKGYQADIDGLRQMHPGMLTFEKWLSSGYWLGTAKKRGKKVMEGIRA